MRLNVDRGSARVGAALAVLALLLWTCASPPAFADAKPASHAELASLPARSAPAWLREGLIYEVYPRAFSASGDFKGVTAQLDRLKSLGVTVVWLMPIHPVGRLKAKGTLGSPYAVRDYDAVNPEFGSAEDLRQLIAAAHQRGMKVFIDIVINHTSWDSVLLEKHRDWYTRDQNGQVIPPNPDWVDVADLDWSNQGLRRYMTGMLVRWLRDFDLDGFRCDYAAGVPVDFWNALRPELDRAKPGIALLAESDEPAFLLSAFDVDYAWDFYHVVSEAIAGRQPASAVRASWEAAEAKYPRGALRLRFSDNHDQLRATGQFGLQAALAASALMYTLDGVPLLYNGMEIGDTNESAAPALFEKAPISWEMAERRPKVSSYYQALAALRRGHSAFTRGAVRWVRNSEEQRVLSFERVAGGESLLVVVNLSSQPFAGSVAAGDAGYRDITPAIPGVASTTRAARLPAIALSSWEFKVFSRGTP